MSISNRIYTILADGHINQRRLIALVGAPSSSLVCTPLIDVEPISEPEVIVHPIIEPNPIFEVYMSPVQCNHIRYA